MEIRAAECTYSDARENADERKTFRESAALARDAAVAADLPLIVISHDPNLRDPESSSEVNRATNLAWKEMQEELFHLTAKGTHIVAKGSGHYIQIDRLDVVIDAFHTMVNQVRNQ